MYNYASAIVFFSYLDDRKVKSTTNKTKTNINSMTWIVFILKIMKKNWEFRGFSLE